MEDFSSTQTVKQTRIAGVMDPIKPILDKWIQEDLKKKKKV